MQIVSLGKIAPATAGTPQRLTSDTTITASKIILSQVAGTTGTTIFGLYGSLNRSTLAGGIKQFLAPGASGFLDFIEITPANGGRTITVADYAVDAANNGEGLLISYEVE
jgi:hypothetical protein